MLGLTDNMEDIFTTNQQKAFKYAKMTMERMDLLGNQVIEILPQTYLHCYKLCLALGEQEIAESPQSWARGEGEWSGEQEG